MRRLDLVRCGDGLSPGQVNLTGVHLLQTRFRLVLGLGLPEAGVAAFGIAGRAAQSVKGATRSWAAVGVVLYVMGGWVSPFWGSTQPKGSPVSRFSCGTYRPSIQRRPAPFLHR